MGQCSIGPVMKTCTVDFYNGNSMSNQMVFKSALRTVGEPFQCKYLKYWMGKEGLPLLECWEKSGKLTVEGNDPPGHKLNTYYDLLEIECKLKTNKMIAVMQLWSPKSQQHNLPLNKWITKVHNMVDLCRYSDIAKDRIVRDILISGCNSKKTKDKIIREPDEPNLDRNSSGGRFYQALNEEYNFQ